MAKGNQIAAKELRERGEAELKSLLASKVEELQKARFKHALGQLRTTHTLNSLRRELARIETVMKERTLAGKSSQAGSETVSNSGSSSGSVEG